MNATTVSAIIPTYNRSRYVTAAIDSVLAQTRPVDEIIVVDDGSTDDTYQVLRRYGDAIRVVRQANAGAAAARNRGMREAGGDFLAFLDSDDLWLPEKTALQLEFLGLRPHLDCVFGDMSNFTGMPDFSTPEIKNPALHAYLVAHGDNLTELLEWLMVENVIPTPTVMLRRSVARRIGEFDENLVVAEDFEYWLRVAAACPCGFINRVLMARRRHDQNLVGNWTRLNLGLANVLARTAAGVARNRPKAVRLATEKLEQIHYDLGSAYLKRRAFGRAYVHLRQSRPPAAKAMSWRVKLAAASVLRWLPAGEAN